MNYENRNKIKCFFKSFVRLAVSALILLCVSPSYVSAASETVRVAVIDYPNYLQMQPDGTVSGYAYEYLIDIQQYTGWEYEFVEMSFEDAVKALAVGEIDVLPGNQYTEERARLYDYSKRDMGEGGSVLCVLPENMQYCYNDYSSYNGLKIAALKGSVRMEQTRKMLAEYGVSVDFVPYDTDAESKAALQSGEVDAILMSTIRCEADYKILARINSAPLYFCTNRQRPELKTELDRAMDKLHLDFPYYEEQQDEKYYGSIPIQLSFTKEEQEFIAANEEITVAVSDDLAPVEYYSDTESAYCGVVPDSFGLLAQYSGLHFHFVSRRDTQTMQEQLASGSILLLASVANDEKIANQWGVSLTVPYFNNSVSVVSNSHVDIFDDAAGTTVLRTGYPYLEQVAQGQGYTNIIYADTFSDCITAVEKGQADLTLIPSNCADTLIRDSSYKNLSTYTIPDTYMDYCVGVSEAANPLLISILNKSITSISREQKTELLVQNLSAVSHTVTIREFLAANRLFLMLLALTFTVILLAGAVLIAISRQRTNLKLRAALEKADAANLAKTDFLARVSHDMRTPMNGILGLCYLMEDQEEKEIKRELPQMREAGEYLLTLINDVLDVNRIESGRMELNPKPCEEEQLFSSVIALLKPQMEHKNITFHFEKKHVEWTRLMVDEQRVKQIFVNLLSNAVKFTPEAGRVDFIMEFVSKDEDRIQYKFVVRDTGIGMSESFIPKLFEPFAQENRLEGGAVGTGLGLAIVKNLVECMGGSISVSSKINEGTEFTLHLGFPLAKDVQETSRQSEKLTPKLPSGTRILLCEDHPLNAQIAIKVLEKQGAVVIWKEDGQLGVSAFAESSLKFFDAVLMDIRMPIMDGLTAAKAIRALPREDAKTVPIIAMTANAYDEDIKKSLDAGMNAHLAKPIEPEKLYDTLAKLIRNE